MEKDVQIAERESLILILNRYCNYRAGMAGILMAIF